MSKHVLGEKCRKHHICINTEFERGITPEKLMAFELALMCIKIKLYIKFQLNMSKHAGEKCGK